MKQFQAAALILSILLCAMSVQAMESAPAEEAAPVENAAAWQEGAQEEGESVEEEIAPEESAPVPEAPAEETVELVCQETTPAERIVPEAAAFEGDAFLSYLEGTSGVRNQAALQAKAGASLDGLNAELYDRLREKIQEIAAGAERSASFSLMPDELESDFNIRLEATYSNEELEGMDDAAIYEQIFQPMINALRSQMDSVALVQALMADCPLDFYWFDKSQGYIANPSVTYGRSYVSIGGRITTWTFQAYITHFEFLFTVAEEFRDPAMDPYSAEYETTLRGDLGETLELIRETAEGIVRENAWRSDYGKLCAYKDAICGRVSYNYEAAGDDSYPYGNPWQLLYVFDGDPNTNVVCEGYSKAFQYLCDLTDFRNDVECYSISGLLVTDDNPGGGGHMWNHVRIDDTFYLADLTNCDDSAVGAPDKLFLKGIDLYPDWGTGYLKWFRSQYTGYANLENPYTAEPEAVLLSDTDFDPDSLPLATLTAEDLLVSLDGSAPAAPNRLFPVERAYDAQSAEIAVSLAEADLAAGFDALTVYYVSPDGSVSESAPVSAGAYSVGVRVEPKEGSAFQSGSVELGLLTIVPMETALATLDEAPESAAPGETFSFTVALTDGQGNPLPAWPLTVSAVGCDAGSSDRTTDENGRVQIDVVMGTEGSDASIVIACAGSENYSPASLTIPVAAAVDSPPEIEYYLNEKVAVHASDPALFGAAVYVGVYTPEGRFLACFAGTIDDSGDASIPVSGLEGEYTLKCMILDSSSLIPLFQTYTFRNTTGE